jgi:hypothetical protein
MGLKQCGSGWHCVGQLRDRASFSLQQPADCIDDGLWVSWLWNDGGWRKRWSWVGIGAVQYERHALLVKEPAQLVLVRIAQAEVDDRSADPIVLDKFSRDRQAVSYRWPRSSAFESVGDGDERLIFNDENIAAGQLRVHPTARLSASFKGRQR